MKQELTGLQKQVKRLISLSELKLPDKLYSYDAREYSLEIGKLVGGKGFYINYFCIFHDDILVKSSTLKNAKRDMILKLNTQFIEQGFVGKEYDFKEHKLKNLPSWCKQ